MQNFFPVFALRPPLIPNITNAIVTIAPRGNKSFLQQYNHYNTGFYTPGDASFAYVARVGEPGLPGPRGPRGFKGERGLTGPAGEKVKCFSQIVALNNH